MHPMLNIAILAARKAGNFIAKHYETPSAIEVSQKVNHNFVTNVDLEAKRLIIEVIRKYYPQQAIIGEENCELAGEYNEIQWLIDPLNGTTNFINRFPYFAVSIAVCIKGHTTVAVVYDPMRNELFTATRAQSAQLNGYRLRCGAARDLTRDFNGAIIATSFSWKQKQHTNNYIDIISKLFIKCADLRHTGSAALDLAYVAAGRLDGFFDIGLKHWSFAGGELLVREAGGLVTHFTGVNNFMSSNIVAGKPRVVKKIIATIRNEIEALNLLN